MLKTVGFPSTRTGDQTIVDGNLVFGTAGKGIDFSANPNPAGMTSELLNDYEEGTWTPLISADGTGSPAFVSTSALGRYVKVGKLVTISCEYTYTSIGTVAGSFGFMTGLPFTSQSNSVESTCSVNIEQAAFDTRAFYAILPSNGSSTLLFRFNNGEGAVYAGGAPYMTGLNFPTAGSVRFVMSYFASA